MLEIMTLDKLNPSGKKVLLRIDVNVPIVNGLISDDTRIRHILPTLIELHQKNAKIILVTHFGRPKGQPKPELSLAPIANALSKLAGLKINFCTDIIGDVAKNAVSAMKNGEILMLENIRFDPSEEKNDMAFAKKLADLADVFVNDAFSVAHRAHASTEGVTHFLPTFAGRGMQAELVALDKALNTQRRPVAAVVGGSKVSTKIPLLENLIKKVDLLVIGGGMANTFLAAQGHKVGKSLCETEFLGTAFRIMKMADETNTQILLPRDVVVAKTFAAHAPYRVCGVSDVQDDEMILDVGLETVALLKQTFASMKTILWNGPLGAFELTPFDAATVETARIVAELTQKGRVTSIAGGGDTVSALNHAGVADKFTYMSTAGGAFLEWLEGKELPALSAIYEKKQQILVAS
jgi:phosphoglycerate kinase